MLAAAFLTNTVIYINIWITIEYGRKQVLIELNRESGEKPERSRHCRVEPCALCHWGRYAYLGKACKTMKPSQENCLFLHHRWRIGVLMCRACERWVGD